MAYYQRRWGTFLRASLGLVLEGFGLPWPATLRGAWYVMRANRAWASYPDNYPDRAREYMYRFYALVARHSGETFDLDEAAKLEVEWWRIHRYLQRGTPRGEDHVYELDDLTRALASRYSHIDGVPADAVREAAVHRAEAMRISDDWVEAGANRRVRLWPPSATKLVKGYALLRVAVQ